MVAHFFSRRSFNVDSAKDGILSCVITSSYTLPVLSMLMMNPYLSSFFTVGVSERCLWFGDALVGAVVGVDGGRFERGLWSPVEWGVADVAMVGCVALYRFCRLFCIMTDRRGLLAPRDRSAPGDTCRLATSTAFASRQTALRTSCALAADDSAVCIIKSKLDRELLLVLPSVAVAIC